MLSSDSTSAQAIPDQSWDDEDIGVDGRASEYCFQLLEDASHLLKGKLSWNEEAARLTFGGFDHYLLPPDPDTSEEDLSSACYMMPLPIAIGDEPWAAYMLELNLMLVARTGFSLAADYEHGLVLTRRLPATDMNSAALANTVEEACDVVDSVVRDYLFEVADES